MALPLKAILYEQLKKTGDALPPSGHDVEKVVITAARANVADQTGFYKPVDAVTNPKMLAKGAVGISVHMEMFMGAQVSRDHLVLDAEKEIIGTVSRAIPKFKPMLATGDTIPADVQEYELVCPSVATMMSHGMACALVGSHLSNDDDCHNGNIGPGLVDGKILYSLIDHDLRYADEWAEALKTLRLVDGVIKEVPAKGLPVKRSDLDNFPNVTGKTFYPPYDIPGNLNFSKRFMNYAEFKALAANPVLETEHGTESFQQQVFYEMLKFLVTFDPVTLRARLEEEFGDIPLDYLSLPARSAAILSERSSTRYNTETNRQPFADYMLGLVQKKYDEAYRAIVFYLGCDKNLSGVKVMGFNEFLQNNPSAWRKILAWAMKENERIAGDWTNPACFFKRETLEKRYHQIWRDSRVLLMQEWLSNANKISDSLANELSSKPSHPLSPRFPMSTDDPELKSAGPLIGSMFKSGDLPVSTDCAPGNTLKIGLDELNNMIKELGTCSEHYYNILAVDTLNDAENQFYSEAVQRILLKYKVPIQNCLANTQWFEPYAKIIRDLIDYQASLDFSLHRVAPDVKPGHEKQPLYAALLHRQHTEKEVVEGTLKALFDWADRIDTDVFNQHIVEIISKYYNPMLLNLLADRTRSNEVQTYLKTSTENGANKLAGILATGGTVSTSLNTLLIEHLMPHVIRDAIGRVDCNLRSLEQAHQRNAFEVLFYTEKAVEYAKTNTRFDNFYSANTAKRVNDAIYRWVNELQADQYANLVNDALFKYEPHRYNYFSNRTRGGPVRAALAEKTMSNQQKLAFVFSQGGIGKTSLNTHLFRLVLEDMQTSIPVSRKMAADALRVAKTPAQIEQANAAVAAANHPDYDLIMKIEIGKAEQFNHFLGSLEKHSKPYSYSSHAEKPAESIFFSLPAHS